MPMTSRASRFFAESVLLLCLFSAKLNEASAKTNPVGITLTEDQLTSLCKFDKVTSGYNVCQKVTQADGSPNYLVTETLDMMCDAVKEALGFKCSRCLALESPEGSNFMVSTCALAMDCQVSFENESAWMYLTTQALKVDVPAEQKCDGNGFKLVYEECSGEKKTE